MTSLVTVLAAASVLHTSAALSYRICESPLGKVHTMSISGCEAFDTCTVRRGQTRTLLISFTPYTASRLVRTVVHVRDGWWTLPVPMDNPATCPFSLTCPLTPATTYHYKFNVSIEYYTPKFKGQVKWELQDEQDRNLACVEFLGAVI